jgi:hypothetical protein
MCPYGIFYNLLHSLPWPALMGSLHSGYSLLRNGLRQAFSLGRFSRRSAPPAA